MGAKSQYRFEWRLLSRFGQLRRLVSGRELRPVALRKLPPPAHRRWLRLTGPGRG
jgi:hypothetical protein